MRRQRQGTEKKRGNVLHWAYRKFADRLFLRKNMLGLPSLNAKTLHPLGGSRIELDAFQVDCGHQPEPGTAIGFPMFSSGFLNPTTQVSKGWPRFQARVLVLLHCSSALALTAQPGHLYYVMCATPLKVGRALMAPTS